VALLEVQNICVHFGGIAALDDVSLSVDAGEIHGVIGPNGAGKTSLINAITGIVRAEAGRVSFAGDDITRLRPEAIAGKGLGRTFQHAEPFSDCTVFTNVLTGSYRHQHYGLMSAAIRLGKAAAIERDSRQSTNRVLSSFGLAPYAEMPARDLPFGLQKRLDIARALAAKPRLLLLDEPVSGMSEGEADETVATIKDVAARQGITLLVVEHNMRVLMNLATAITVLDQGKVIARGTPQEVRANPDVVRAYLGDG
jgi:branched-chain amino acid transport system ATP-binding protein